MKKSFLLALTLTVAFSLSLIPSADSQELKQKNRSSLPTCNLNGVRKVLLVNSANPNELANVKRLYPRAYLCTTSQVSGSKQTYIWAASSNFFINDHLQELQRYTNGTVILYSRVVGY